MAGGREIWNLKNTVDDVAEEEKPSKKQCKKKPLKKWLKVQPKKR